MYFTKTPTFIQSLFSDYVWRIPCSDRILYLTFDDGPIPEVTQWVLDLLKSYNAKATFFCVGENVHRHPEIYQALTANNHVVGNHTHHHLNGWQTNNVQYLEDVTMCENFVESDLFRPPYGRLRPAQAKQIKQKYKIILWDVLTGDFDPNQDKEKRFQNIVKHTKPGSILVFHDSLKAAPILKELLPRVLTYYHNKGYKFEALDKKAFSKY